MDFIKTLKDYHITYLPEFPPEDVKVEENTVIAVPGEKKGQFKLYTWFENKWVYTSFIDKSDFDLKELKDAYDDLSNAVKKLTKLLQTVKMMSCLRSFQKSQPKFYKQSTSLPMML